MTGAFDERNSPTPEDAGIEGLLRQVGARDEPSEDLMREVHAKVHAEWQTMIQGRRRRRLFLGLGLAAGLAGILVLGLGPGFLTPGAVPVAQVVQVDGRLLLSSASDGWTTPQVGQQVASGEMLRTDERSRAALSVGSLSVRLDHDTLATFAAVDRIELISGALYVDLPPGSQPTPLAVQSRGVTVRHVGTQYQVRARDSGVEISVREGKVTLQHGSVEEPRTTQSSAGERILITSLGDVHRSVLPPYEADWQWAAMAAPAFDIDHQSLSVFLDWLARETGRRIEYDSPQAQHLASQTQLHGSIEGLNLDTALKAVLATTPLRHVDSSTDRIRIALGD